MYFSLLFLSCGFIVGGVWMFVNVILVRKVVYLMRLLIDEYWIKVGLSWFIKIVIDFVVFF